ncbi:hypothetical protein INR49_011918 [Caranx melampygus]|nr:hypothetical protein INR49_011918 [Caranx melampygus]
MCNDSVLSAGFQIDTPDTLGQDLPARRRPPEVEENTTGETLWQNPPALRCSQSSLSVSGDSGFLRHQHQHSTDQWGRSALHYAAASDLDRSAALRWSRRAREFRPSERRGGTMFGVPAAERSDGVSEGQTGLQPRPLCCLPTDTDTVWSWSVQPQRRHRLITSNMSNTSESEHNKASKVCVFPCDLQLLHRDDSHHDDPDSPSARSPLHLAAYHGHAQALEVLLQGHREVDQGDEVGRTPLALAALRGHTDCVHTLLSQGRRRAPLMPSTADTSSPGSDEWSYNVCAPPAGRLLCGQEECIQCLLEQEASVLIGDSRGRTPIHLAAARGHASWLSELLSIACSEPPSLPPLRDQSGYTPLHWACYYGQEGCVEVLLEQKGCRCIDGNPFTPLHCAVVNDHESCASLLLEAMGSDIAGCKDAKGRTPLHAAAFSGHVDCVQLLLSHDAPVDAMDQSGRTPLMMAAEKGRGGALELLMSSDCDLTQTDGDGNTALHLSCSNGKEDCVLLILEKLSDSSLVNAANAALQTPLHLAARSGLKQAVQELLSRGASVQTLRGPVPRLLLRQLPHQGGKGPATGPRGPRSPRTRSGPSSEGTPENDSEDSETF